MKKYFLILLLSFALFFEFILANYLVLAYQPPIYTANPETQECRYYFAGGAECFDACMEDCQGSGWNYTNCFPACADPCHYNPRPDGFSEDIGETTQFKDEEEACKKWKSCMDREGKWNSASLSCEEPKKPYNYRNLFFASLVVIIAISILSFINNRNLRKKIKELRQEEPEKKE